MKTFPAPGFRFSYQGEDQVVQRCGRKQEQQDGEQQRSDEELQQKHNRPQDWKWLENLRESGKLLINTIVNEEYFLNLSIDSPGPGRRSTSRLSAAGRSTSSPWRASRETTGRRSSGSRAWRRRTEPSVTPNCQPENDRPTFPSTHEDH